MYEVEVKVRADRDEIRPRLLDRGAESLGSVRQIDTYYDHPTRSFAETDEALRVRRESEPGTEDDHCRLTYKGPLVESASKTREEIETGVDDGGAIDDVLQAVDFEPVADVEKRRERYALSGFTVTLDAVTDLGEFVEVEREARKEDIESVREGARDLLRDLGLNPDDHVQTSYLGFLLGSG